ncbi:L-asparaginase [Flagelloscypha sp. PMI_526]|nr:L-asparaginase [Flagelloscypha sp. PMI_526]
MESKVLVIYTGGTIGMMVGAHGYRNERNFLSDVLRSQDRFHDPLQDSLFSHSSSIEGYRQWSRFNKFSPRSSSFDLVSDTNLPTLTVRSSQPINTATNLEIASNLDNVPIPNVAISEDVYEAQLPSLVTPKSSVAGSQSKSIRYAILEWHPLLDSSNIDIKGMFNCNIFCNNPHSSIDWVRIATEIELNYSLFDAFVVLHGTDTMAYSSSALSFLLEDLGKTVILTGAQIPLSALRNDAVENLLGALTIAGHFIIPEVCVYFNHNLFRGNRVSKSSSYDFNAFQSPNFPPLVDVGIDILVRWENVIRQTGLRKFKAHKELSPHVAVMRLFPGMDKDTIKAFFQPNLRGVVLETFGAGNAPERADLKDALQEACARGVVVVAITQCAKGTVSDVYETGRKLLQTGVIPGVDMTPECALAKLSYLLSKPELSTDEVRQLVGTPLRGELSRPSTVAPSAPTDPTSIGQNLESIQNVLSQFMRLSVPKETQNIPTLVLSRADSTDSTTSIQDSSTAPWSWTAAEAASTEAVLLPFLIHLAAARDDIESLKFCISGTQQTETSTIPGGLANCPDITSGLSPLHVAALNGNKDSTALLLQTGALVHLRDHLDHTPLYYAARQGHSDVVDLLVQAGAALGGSDQLFLRPDMNIQQREKMQKIWEKVGVVGSSSVEVDKNN